jgi:A/G-specific adenine glycosylase
MPTIENMKQLLTTDEILRFRSMIWEFYKNNRRLFPWRYNEDPYHIVVSEIMLQQTQTYRVEPKFDSFVKRFPAWQDLASANWPEVLTAWQGLGYNNRAKRLHDIAKRIIHEYQGVVPQDPDVLVTFPGIGPNTAGSICAFAFNKPTIFAETNIRAVFIYHFFPGKEKVHDRYLIPLVQATLDATDPRSWYYALMDYGVWLKKQTTNPTRRSAHYTKQSKFKGSDREIRSMILKKLLAQNSLTELELTTTIERDPGRIKKITQDLCNEHLIQHKDGKYYLA